MLVQNAILRRDLMHRIRLFFMEKNCLEVEVPLMGRGAGTDPHLDLFSTIECASGERLYFHSSPEFFLKRLLAEGYPDLFFMGPTFRNGESGKRHLPQFTMLEWYRLGFGPKELMLEILDLLSLLKNQKFLFQSIPYVDLFQRYLGIDYKASVEEWKEFARVQNWGCGDGWSKQDFLDYALSAFIEPQLGKEGPQFVYPYPPDQAALARIEGEGDKAFAHRFELYINGIELANGYWELGNAQEQAHRFAEDLKMRQSLGKEALPIDEKFLEALQRGFPDCSGVALGVDRLLMWVLDLKDIQEIVPFAWENW